MKAGSAAKLIVDALLQRFLPLARRRIETAQVQVRFLLVLSILLSVCVHVCFASLSVCSLVIGLVCFDYSYWEFMFLVTDCTDVYFFFLFDGYLLTMMT